MDCEKQHTTFVWKDKSARNSFYVRKFQPTTSKPRAVLFYLHGLNNFVDETPLTRFGLAAADKNFIFMAYDQRGFGKSAPTTTGTLGLIKNWKDLVSDCREFVEHVMSAENEDLPFFICGFSMGGALSLILSLELDFQAGIWKQFRGLCLISPAISIAQPPNYIRTVLGAFTFFGGASLEWGPAGTDLGFRQMDSSRPWTEWEIRQGCSESVEELRNSPLSPFPNKMLLGTADQILSLADFLMANIQHVAVSFFCAHGTGDALAAPSGSGLLYSDAKSSDKLLRLYEGACHAMLCDPLFEQVMNDMWECIASHLVV